MPQSIAIRCRADLEPYLRTRSGKKIYVRRLTRRVGALRLNDSFALLVPWKDDSWPLRGVLRGRRWTVADLASTTWEWRDAVEKGREWSVGNGTTEPFLSSKTPERELTAALAGALEHSWAIVGPSRVKIPPNVGRYEAGGNWHEPDAYKALGEVLPHVTCQYREGVLFWRMRSGAMVVPTPNLTVTESGQVAGDKNGKLNDTSIMTHVANSRELWEFLSPEFSRKLSAYAEGAVTHFLHPQPDSIYSTGFTDVDRGELLRLILAVDAPKSTPVMPNNHLSYGLYLRLKNRAPRTEEEIRGNLVKAVRHWLQLHLLSILRGEACPAGVERVSHLARTVTSPKHLYGCLGAVGDSRIWLPRRNNLII